MPHRPEKARQSLDAIEGQAAFLFSPALMFAPPVAGQLFKIGTGKWLQCSKRRAAAERNAILLCFSHCHH